jgi:competence protein ComFB
MIRNVVEEHVQTAYAALRPHFPDFCGCDICRDDALVFALNRTPPRYVSSLAGSILTEVNLEKDQSRAAIDVAMMEALRRISLAPRCGRAPRGADSPPA